MYRHTTFTEEQILKALDYIIYLDERMDKLEDTCQQLCRKLTEPEDRIL